MKIVLIAGFSNPEIREHLVFKKDHKLYHWLIRLFHLPARVWEFRDHAPWIPSLISDLENREDVELHVVGPQIRLKNHVEEFSLRGVHYHFYRSDLTSLLRKVGNYRVWKSLQNASRTTSRIIRRINPDIVVLSGAENPATSINILYAKDYPRLCLCQTIYNNPERSQYSNPNRLIQEMEKDIFSHLQYFGVYCGMHYRLLRKFRPNATIFKFGYPSKGKLLDPVEVEKEYDFVNFALMHGSRKGTTDSIQALAIVKKKYPNVTLNIVGGCDPAGLENLTQMCEQLGVTENVIFTPFFEKKEDLILHVQKSRFAVLPCKLDHTSGTMSQSMQLGLPLVVYKTTGTPAFNREKQCALIAEKENVEELAQHMLSLMDNPELAEELRRNAHEFQEHKAKEHKLNGDRLIATMKAVIDNYRDGTPIPEVYLFNLEKDD